MSDRALKLYRFYDGAGNLIYVGMTINPGRRMERHRTDKPWWNDVSTIEMETYETLDELRAAERDAIRNEQPRHNIRHAGEPVIVQAVSLSPELCEELLHGVCRGVATCRVWPLGRDRAPDLQLYVCGMHVERYSDWERI